LINYNHKVDENTRIVIEAGLSFYLQQLKRRCDGVPPSQGNRSWRVWEMRIDDKSFPVFHWLCCCPTMKMAREVITAYTNGEDVLFSRKYNHEV
tara:strand:+ start:2473 stop:2754 length:282 start_codon:yes stop_codon:yes gene_type:complete